MAKKENNHTTFRNQKLFCTHCGGTFDIPIPLEVTEMTKKINSFNDLHMDCKPVWKQPEPDMSTSVEDRKTFWLSHGEKGMSSEAMFSVLSGTKTLFGRGLRHPCDPSDFRRCYQLLQTIPEWRAELHKMKAVSGVWSKLVDNWSKLEEMLLEQMETKKANGMYEFMETLGA